jgi:hypothetical protein
MADKNLRLDSQFSIIGTFWSPETPDAIMKGTLVSDEREIAAGRAGTQAFAKTWQAKLARAL